MCIKRRTFFFCCFCGALLIGLVGLACIWWLQAPSKTRQLAPLLAELERYSANHGSYPTSCVSLASFSQLTNQFRIYTGDRGENDITWDPHEVSGHDFTILVGPFGYEIFYPVGRIKMISFSSFPVWRIDSTDKRWQKGKIHWSLAGTYPSCFF